MISPKLVERGQLQGAFPYVRVGDGPQTLLVVPGLGDAMFDGEYGPLAARGIALYLRRFFDDHTVYVVSRPRGLDEGTSIREMAADYARILDRDPGPASVLGVSMGGLISQKLAYQRPDLVDRLVVAVSGCRLGADGEPIVHRLQKYARDREWVEIRARLLREMYACVRWAVYPRVASTAGHRRPPAEPQDVTVSIDAVLDFDGTDRLGGIDAPTLVTGGTEDVFFPKEILRETRDGLSDAELVMFNGARHGAFHEHKETFDAIVSTFLAGESVQTALPR